MKNTNRQTCCVPGSIPALLLVLLAIPALEPALAIDSDKIHIAKSKSEIETEKEKKKSAEFSLSIDQANKIEVSDGSGGTKKINKEVISTDFAVWYSDLLRTEKSQSHRPLLAPYIEVNYKSNIDPAKETDNLTFGMILKGDLPKISYAKGPFGIKKYFIGAGWITDIEQFESSQWLTTLTIPLLAFGRSADRVTDKMTWDWLFFGDLAADYSDIEEIGDKKALAKLKSYSRIGYDLQLSSIWRFSDEGWSAELEGTYHFRDNQSDGAANADLWDASLNFTPAKDSKVSYALTYKRGENLYSLEELEIWQFALKFTR